MKFQLPKFINKQVFSWALYDWANSAFATVVLAGFFPLFFKHYWSSGSDATVSTFQLGVGNSLASVIIVILAPVLGAIADASCAKKRFLLFFALLGIVMTSTLYFVAEGNWTWAIILFVLASVGFSGGNIFYDALIMDIAPSGKLDLVSSFGYSLGYFGGGILFAIDIALTVWPETFGFADKSEAVRAAFVSVAVWWLLFSIPLWLFVHEAQPTEDVATGLRIRAGFQSLKNTFHEIRKLRVVVLFLVAYWLYIDGVDTVIRMAVDFGASLGFDSNNLITALLITQFVGFPATLLFGMIGNRIGAKIAILMAIAVYIIVLVWASTMQHVSEFYGLAIVIGLVQGGVQSLSRSFYARIIPANKSAEFFGFYNMLGKFAAVLGPLMIGVVALVSGSPRIGILSITVLFIFGAVLLYFVDEQKGITMAREMEESLK